MVLAVSLLIRHGKTRSQQRLRHDPSTAHKRHFGCRVATKEKSVEVFTVHRVAYILLCTDTFCNVGSSFTGFMQASASYNSSPVIQRRGRRGHQQHFTDVQQMFALFGIFWNLSLCRSYIFPLFLLSRVQNLVFVRGLLVPFSTLLTQCL